MKTFLKALAILSAALGLSSLARAALPTVQSVFATSIQLGESTTLSASVADVDGDLNYVWFYASGPGIEETLDLGDIGTPGYSGVYTRTWQPSQAGVYTLHVLVVDMMGGSSYAQRPFEVFAGKLVIAPTTVASAVNRIHEFPGEIVTTENTSTANTIVQSGGNFILWSGGRVVLKPGFQAQAGSFFWAAVDHDMNGYSDIEEATDTDGDGMFDAWEVDHGLNPLVNDANGDRDGDGTSNFQEFLTGRNPNDRSDGATLPINVQLIVKTASGGYLGINTSTWQISSAPNP